MNCCGARGMPARSNRASSCPRPAATIRPNASRARSLPPATEERLIPALKLFGSASPLRLAQLLARGLFASAPSGELRDCLARMGLDHPSGATARVEAALLHAALEASS